MTTHVVIMAGGIGSRMAPLSTPEHPKQFIDLLGCGKTLIQLTYERFLKLDPKAVFWVVTSKEYVHFVHEQLPSIDDDFILAEPVARNTAPCIAYACRKIWKRFSDANIVVTPADAYVPDAEAFSLTIKKALLFTAASMSLMCVGVTPTSPHTGYGYIKCDRTDKAIVPVASFKEKPDLETAKRFLEEGGYFWNAGIFVWNARAIDSALRRYVPDIAARMDMLEPSMYTDAEAGALAEIFPTCEKISIDYAVMEKSDDVFVIHADWFWSDLGSFEALEQITGKKVEINLENCS